MFTILKKDPHTRARRGVLETAHGVVETPSYVNVGTHAKVRSLTMEDCIKGNTQMIIVNTYHMWKMLGDEGIASFPGLHSQMGWNKPLMTDSGGFQVFSMGAARTHGVGKVGNEQTLFTVDSSDESIVRITNDGVFFYEEGKEVYLDAEKSIALQQKLGADCIVAFDEPTSPLHEYEYTKESLTRTHAWELRSLHAHTSSQLLYGIVQGGVFEDLRKQSAEFVAGLPFDGYAIGGAFGSSFGSQKEDTFEELTWVCPLLPDDKPRHLLGIGLIEDLFEGVERGIDTFDCVIPTREGRHAGVWTSKGRINLRRGKFVDDRSPIEKGCTCPVCGEMNLTKSDIHVLVKEKSDDAGRYCSLHNVWFFNNLMEKIRDSIANNNFRECKKEYLSKLLTNN